MTSHSGSSAARPWLIFDGDDTLWRTTSVYEAARHRVAALIAARGHDHEAAIAWSKVRDLENAKVMGYSMHRFPRSLRETAEHYLGDGEHAWAALGHGYSVFSAVCQPTEGVGYLLERLTRHWNLALLTAGEATIQEKRLTDFPWTSLFATTRIVPSKSPAVYRAFLDDLGADPATTWVVGDSLRSDIHPAHEIGCNAVHYDTENWACYEMNHHERPHGSHVISSLSDLQHLLSEHTENNKARTAG